MTQRTTGWRSVFSLPAVYRFAQRSIGSPEVRAAFVNERVRPSPGDRILDIGCGTGDIVQLLGQVEYIGYDPKAEYIESARERYGDLGEFFVGSVGAVDLEPESFDICIAKGVLHHLDDGAAVDLFREAARVLRPGGRLITMDPVLTDDQPRIARFLTEHQTGAKTFERLTGTSDSRSRPWSRSTLRCATTSSACPTVTRCSAVPADRCHRLRRLRRG